MFSWEELENELSNCKGCSLHTSRNNVVLGRGNKDADILLIGEGPGADEDASGLPFVGAAGKLLDDILNATGIAQDDIYIANIVKCRPPGNRVPTNIEAIACIPFLRNQALLVKPKIIICLGSTASRYILRDKELKITQARGNIIFKNDYYYMPTFHPAALLRDESKKIDLYKDIKKVKELYDKLKEE